MSPEQVATKCPHHWRIGEAVSPEVSGECLKCGAQRMFRTGWDSSWGPSGGDGLHYLFLQDDRKNWAGEWISDRQREGWSW